MQTEPGNSESKDMQDKVIEAHERQEKRFEGTGIHFNSEIPASEIGTYCPMDTGAAALLENAFERMSLSARGYHRIIKVARTAADLSGCDRIGMQHVSEAILYRTIDRKYWRM